LATDLLIGVTLGIVVKLAINLARGVWPANLFKIHFTIQQQDDDTLVIKLLGSALFSNVLPLKMYWPSWKKVKGLFLIFQMVT